MVWKQLLWTEKTSVAPQMVYSQAKYATELLLESLSKMNKTLKYCSLRLGTLGGGAPGLVEVDFLSRIVRNAYEGQTINLIGGMQQMERFDIRDAIDAIETLLSSNPQEWYSVYNLGSDQRIALKEITELAVEIASKYNGGTFADIIVEDKEVKTPFGLDSSLFYKQFNWKPTYKMKETIESLINYIS